MENARQLQCKALHGREKKPPEREQWETMEKTIKKQCADQSEQSEDPGECSRPVGRRPTGRQRCARGAAKRNATVRHPRDARVTTKKPADQLRRAALAQIRD
jgi:hypothetical protein